MFMTNAEVFEKVFGIKPDTEFSVVECPFEYGNSECKYYEELDGGCRCELWWQEEYKPPVVGNKM